MTRCGGREDDPDTAFVQPAEPGRVVLSANALLCPDRWQLLWRLETIPPCLIVQRPLLESQAKRGRGGRAEGVAIVTGRKEERTKFLLPGGGSNTGQASRII